MSVTHNCTSCIGVHQHTHHVRGRPCRQCAHTQRFSTLQVEASAECSTCQCMQIPRQADSVGDNSGVILSTCQEYPAKEVGGRTGAAAQEPAALNIHAASQSNPETSSPCVVPAKERTACGLFEMNNPHRPWNKLMCTTACLRPLSCLYSLCRVATQIWMLRCLLSAAESEISGSVLYYRIRVVA